MIAYKLYWLKWVGVCGSNKTVIANIPGCVKTAVDAVKSISFKFFTLTSWLLWLINSEKHGNALNTANKHINNRNFIILE